MSGSTIVFADWPQYLPKERVTSQAPATADEIRSIAGANRFLYEHATGQSVDDEAPKVARNPQGLYGHDHSGPPYGTAFLHELASWTCPQSSNDTLAAIAADNPHTVDFLFWCRPFALYDDAPYRNASCAVLVRNTNTSSGVISVTTQSLTEKTAPTDPDTFAVGTTSDGFYGGSGLGSIPILPGWNRVRVTVSRDSGPMAPILQCVVIYPSSRR